MLISEKIRLLRKKKGLKQEDLESLTGINQATVSAYERGKARPSYEYARRLASVFEVEIKELYEGEVWGEPEEAPVVKDKSMQNWNALGEQLSPESRLKAEKLLKQIFEDELDSVKTQKKIS